MAAVNGCQGSIKKYFYTHRQREKYHDENTGVVLLELSR